MAVLLVTALAQGAIFVATGSVALLADLIHNFGDALTAIPLGIAFLLRSFVAEKRAGYFVVAAILVITVRGLCRYFCCRSALRLLVELPW